MSESKPTSPGYLINRASRLFSRVGDRRLQELGTSSGQIPILVALKGGARLSQKELAQLAQIEQPTMAYTLARMERDGWIEREPDAADKRSSLIRLRPETGEKLPLILQALVQLNEDALGDLSIAEREVLIALLRRVVVNLEATESM